MNYFVLTTFAHDGGLIEMYPDKSPAGWRFDEGQSLIREFPRAASVQFSDNYPDARKVYDFQPNTLDALIISDRVRKVLESLEVTNAEYLPVAIKDHKSQIVGKDHAFLNLLGGEDAIDLERSEYKMNNINKEQIARIKKLAINEKGIRPGAKIFRCSKKLRLVLINEEVLEAFKKAGLTGYQVFKAEGWDGLEI
jgi:hypothetical protein